MWLAFRRSFPPCFFSVIFLGDVERHALQAGLFRRKSPRSPCRCQKPIV